MSASVVLGAVSLFHMPQGGAVTPGSMVPLWIHALRHGVTAGVLAGAATGLANLLQSAHVYHPLQALLDYGLAYASLGLAGLWPRWPLVGAGLALTARYSCHVLAGFLFFSSQLPPGSNPWLYSLGYNLFLLVDGLVAMAAFLLILRSGTLPGPSIRVADEPPDQPGGPNSR